MSKDKLLRYRIASWEEVSHCLSNTSRKLHLTYDHILTKGLTGGIIRVEHDDFGCLFAYLVNSSGNFLTVDSSGVLFELDVNSIEQELYKYGFIITFDKTVVIDNDQFKLLCTADELNMDKIRIMYVTQKDNTHRAYLVVFNVENLSTWLNNTKICSIPEFTKALQKGYAVNLTQAQGGLHAPHNWTFLDDAVLNIEDVLKYAR